jgi:predicted lipoprotein with Yx(FWY)xxD motif
MKGIPPCGGMTTYVRYTGRAVHFRSPTTAAGSTPTLGGYLLSVWGGLFGFTEVGTSAGLAAGIVDIAGAAVLSVLALAPDEAHPRKAPPGAGWFIGVTSVVALIALSVSVAAATGSAPVTAGTLRSARIGGFTVLTNGSGSTLYSFAPDTMTASKCYGTCAVYWPPVIGSPVAGPGVTGRLGTITRTDGATQATYNGQPLYTYIGDSHPGEANGNNVNLNGGRWLKVNTAAEGRH